MFDASGNRLLRREGGTVTAYLPGGQEVTATATTTSATRWYSFAGTTVAVRTGKGLAGVTSIVSDAHGTPVARIHNTDRTAPVDRIRTDPFGAARTDATGTVAGHGFLGAPADGAGLTLLGARFYDPVTGTFISVDPLLDPGLPAQFNAYVYAGNNPLTWSDPSGQSWGMLADKGASTTAGFKCDTRKIGCRIQATVANHETANQWNKTAQNQRDAQWRPAFLASVVNGGASFGNAMLRHPDLLGALLIGIVSTYLGGAGVAGGGAACLTGVGCFGGAPAVAGSVALAAAGVAAVGASGAGLASHAMTDSKVEVWKNESTPGSSSVNSGKNIHGELRGATREVDEGTVWRDGDLYVQAEDGFLVKVQSQGNGLNHVVIRNPENGNTVTVMDRLTDRQLMARVADGRWQ